MPKKEEKNLVLCVVCKPLPTTKSLFYGPMCDMYGYLVHPHVNVFYLGELLPIFDLKFS